jgi:hypothetical protein
MQAFTCENCTDLEPTWVLALMERIRFRTAFFISICILSASTAADALDPAGPHLQQARESLVTIDRLAKPGAEVKESVQALGIFDPTVVRRLPTQHPPRPMSMLTPVESRSMLNQILAGMSSVLDLDKSRSWSAIQVHLGGSDHDLTDA